MFRKTLSKIGLAVMGIVVALTACQLEITQDKNAAMPVFSIEGAVDYNDTVTIKTETEGADIFYTTDGSAPTAESTKYTGPVAITADCTIKAVAVKAGMQNSIIAEKSFTVKKYTVTFDANGHGTAPGAISGKHKGEVIALPAALSATGFNFGGWSDGTNTYAAGANYTVSGDVTLKAVWTQMPTYTVTFDANGHGTAPGAISGKHKGEVIALPAALTATGYNFGSWSDGTNTYAAGANYTVSGDVTLKAVWTEWNTASAPVFSVADSQIDYNDTVTITTATDGATIYYTTDGSTPTSSGTQYTAPIAITSATTIKAIAVKSGMNNSAVTEKAYTVKTYTVIFNANGHGTAPNPMTGYKTQQITLPQAITASGWSFNNWSDGTNTYAAGATYTVTGNVTISAVWTDVAPSNVTNLTATCTAIGTVKLTWTNPTDDDFAKVVIIYGTGGSETVLKNASPNNEKTITGLTNGTQYTFTIKAYDDAGNASSGMSVSIIPGNGGLQGTPTGGQTQGQVIKESWMDTDGNIKINGTAIAKTSEAVAIPAGTVAKINMTQADAKGSLFTESRKVKLSSFVMSQYPVTRALFKAVMGDVYYNSLDSQANANGTADENPVTTINWFDAIVFCNRLSSLCGLEPVYSYNFSTDESGKMTDPDAWFADTTHLSATVPTDSSSTNYSNWKDNVKINLRANGYRLPTEAEWEFCARGGDPNAADWKYAYSGSNTYSEVCWCYENSHYSTNIVGGMNKANRLGLYDMSGNVWEWCDDYYSDSVWVDDDNYKDNEDYVVDPIVVSVSSGCRRRGGCWYNGANVCEVGNRYYDFPCYREDYYGFRLVRSAE